MNNYYIYISTDANRRFLQPGMSNDISQIFQQINNPDAGCFMSQAVLNRIVYLEQFSSEEEAMRKYQELQQFGRIVRERLIRKQNPNWLSLALPMSHFATNKKAVVYA
ncbi:hypothetical protein GCM10022216_17610 [Sphingobacterium kyonggiense]|uniref:GIY-YIG nuclease family protein n=1 Tax=Sphingobacterium kyonggiense TaxID=714075 RepID=A0ABP7YQN7_9SPHI